MPVTDSAYIALKLFSIFIAAIAIIGNGLVCHIIVRLKTMKTSINYIMLNLAILDAISGISTIYYVLSKDQGGVLVEPILERAYNQSSVLANAVCKIELCYWLPISISPSLLMIMAYERYKAIVDPLSRLDGTVTKARLKWMLPLAWITGLLYSVIDMSYVKYDENQRHCTNEWYNFKIYITFWLSTQYVIPSIAIISFYSLVIYALRRQNNSLGPQAQAERVRRQAKKKVIRIILALTSVFYIFCGIPQVGSVLTTVFFMEKIQVSLLENTLVVLLAMNFAFNPCAYFLFMQSFRDGFRRLFMLQREITVCYVLRVINGSHRSVSTQDMNKSLNEQAGNEPQLLAIQKIHNHVY